MPADLATSSLTVRPRAVESKSREVSARGGSNSAAGILALSAEVGILIN
jgi:hypothetical protein